jgi:DNA-directed RNA polymerase specialized sigma24 family protein
MTGDPGEAEDLVQETFVRIAHRWHRAAVRRLADQESYAGARAWA